MSADEQAAENKAWVEDLCEVSFDDQYEFDIYCSNHIDELDGIESEEDCKSFYADWWSQHNDYTEYDYKEDHQEIR